MNFNICLATLLSLACISTMADDKRVKNPPLVERIEPRTTKVPPPIILPTVDDSGTDRPTSIHRPDPRGQYINLQQGAGAGPVAEIKKTEITFCDYLKKNEAAITRPINSGFNKCFKTAKFTTSAHAGGGYNQYMLLGVSEHDRTDGMVPAFIYELNTGTIFSIKPADEFVVHNIPNNVVIVDRDAFRGQNYWDAVSRGTTPLCGRYINLICN